LPMSFAEIHYRHQVVRVDLAGDALQTITALPIPRPVELLRIPEQPAPLDEVLDRLQALDLPERPRDEQPYLQLRISLTSPQPGLRTQVETVLDPKPVRLARIETCYPGAAGGASEGRFQTLDDLGRLQPEDIFRQLHQRRCHTAPSSELLAAFTELLAAAERENAP